jgi:2-polyprenyl-3-methyl-5-hydroxy-6-metoxy-1,4-benzoquinol methylase
MTPQPVERTRYHKDVETLDPSHPWHRIRQLVPLNAEVLDVGCASGELGEFLSPRTTRVDGIEPNNDRAAHARRHLRRVVAGMAGPAVGEQLRSTYDVVIFADVLEHMTEPERCLRWAGSRLSADGEILALIPNSANWKFRRQILRGDWSYADTGYFDRDHVRFFDVRTARELGQSAGLAEIAVEHVPGQLPKPFRTSWRGAIIATRLRPNLFAGHVLAVWGRPPI